MISTVRAHCHHPGCTEWTFRCCENKADRICAEKWAASWLCLPHQQPERVLAPENPKTVKEHTNQFGDGLTKDKRFWDGREGLITGPGFLAYAEKCPPGTILRITAELIFPE